MRKGEEASCWLPLLQDDYDLEVLKHYLIRWKTSPSWTPSLTSPDL